MQNKNLLKNNYTDNKKKKCKYDRAINVIP